MNECYKVIKSIGLYNDGFYNKSEGSNGLYFSKKIQIYAAQVKLKQQEI